MNLTIKTATIAWTPEADDPPQPGQQLCLKLAFSDPETPETVIMGEDAYRSLYGRKLDCVFLGPDFADKLPVITDAISGQALRGFTRDGKIVAAARVLAKQVGGEAELKAGPLDLRELQA